MGKAAVRLDALPVGAAFVQPVMSGSVAGVVEHVSYTMVRVALRPPMDRADDRSGASAHHRRPRERKAFDSI